MTTKNVLVLTDTQKIFAYRGAVAHWLTGLLQSSGFSILLSRNDALEQNCLLLKKLHPTHLLPQPKIYNHQSSHRFYNGNCAGNDAGVMAAFAFQGGGFSSTCYRLLCSGNSRYRFECNPEIDI